MVDCLEYRNGSFNWNLLIIRKVHDWELESMAQLLDDMYPTKFMSWGKSRGGGDSFPR